MKTVRTLTVVDPAAGLGFAGLIAGSPSATAVEHPTLVKREATRTNMVSWLSNWGGEDSPLQDAP
jgi:hypothetical protein